jgi:outer membrane lipoprotein LolB
MRRLALACAALALAACAHFPAGHDGLSYAARRNALESVSAWEMRGRLAIDTGERGFQAGFTWRQDADHLDLGVRGPFGNGIAQIFGTSSALTVRSRGDTHTLTDPEAELSELLGWWLPVGSLHAWLLGLPDEKFRAAVAGGADGTLAAFDQRLWHVAYPTYQLAALAGTANGVLVPRRIDLAYGPLTLRLTVDAWQAVGAAAP